MNELTRVAKEAYDAGVTEEYNSNTNTVSLRGHRGMLSQVAQVLSGVLNLVVTFDGDDGRLVVHMN